VAENDIEAVAASAREPRFLEWAGPDRVLLALLLTDIVGSTASKEPIKDERMNAVRRALHDEPAVAQAPTLAAAK
jgi:hypothetical protein